MAYFELLWKETGTAQFEVLWKGTFMA